MANTDAPFGFRQYSGNGSAPTYEQIAVSIAYNATAIFFGDPVIPTAGGGVAIAPSPSASRPDQDTPIIGVFVGCKYLSTSQKRTVWSNYWPGSDVASNQTVEGYIINDPNAKFVVQTDSTGLALGAVNGTIGFTTGSGNTANGLSTTYLNSSTLNTATYSSYNPFRVVSIVDAPPGSQGTLSNGQAYDWAIVQFNWVLPRNFNGI